MRPNFRSVLVGLGGVFVIGIFGWSAGPMHRPTFFVLAAVVAGILAFFAKQKPRRITRIVVTVGALVFAGLSYPEAAVWLEHYHQLRESTRITVQPSSPTKVEAHK